MEGVRRSLHCAPSLGVVLRSAAGSTGRPRVPQVLCAHNAASQLCPRRPLLVGPRLAMSKNDPLLLLSKTNLTSRLFLLYSRRSFITGVCAHFSCSLCNQPPPIELTLGSIISKQLSFCLSFTYSLFAFHFLKHWTLTGCLTID